MPSPISVRLPRLVEPLAGILAQRPEQEEALVAERLQQAVIKKRGELVELRSRDGLGGVDIDRPDRLVDGDVTSTGCSAIDEELGRSAVRQRLDGWLTLETQVQWCARGGEHDDLAHEELCDDRGDSRQLLEVVEHEQHTPRSEPADDVVVGLQPDRFGDGGPHGVGLAQRSERDEERAVTEFVREFSRGLQRQPCLARPPDPVRVRRPPRRRRYGGFRPTPARGRESATPRRGDSSFRDT